MSPFDMFRSPEEERPKITYAGEVANLREAYRAIRNVHRFEPGDIVRQRSGCRLYQDFSDNGLRIFLGYLSEPRTVNDDDGNTRTFDAVTGMWIDGAFLTFHVDSGRFEPAPDEEPVEE